MENNLLVEMKFSTRPIPTGSGPNCRLLGRNQTGRRWDFGRPGPIAPVQGSFNFQRAAATEESTMEHHPRCWTNHCSPRYTSRIPSVRPSTALFSPLFKLLPTSSIPKLILNPLSDFTKNAEFWLLDRIGGA